MLNNGKPAPMKILTLADVIRAAVAHFDALPSATNPAAALRDLGQKIVDLATFLLTFSRAPFDLPATTVLVEVEGKPRHLPAWLWCTSLLGAGYGHLRAYHRWPWRNSQAGPYAAGWPVSSATAFGWPSMSALGAALVFGESIARDVHGSLKESVKQIKALREFPEHAEDLGLSAAGDVLVPEYVNDVPGYLVANDMTTVWQASLKKTLQDKVPEARFSATQLEQECERVWTLIDEEYLVAQAAGSASAGLEAQTPPAERGTTPATRPLPAGAGNADMPTNECEILRAIAAALTDWAPFHAKGIARDAQRSDEAKAAARKAMRLMIDNLGLLQKCRVDYGLHSGLNRAFVCLEQAASWPDTRDWGDCWNWGGYFTKAVLDGGVERSFIEEVHRWANKLDQEGLAIAGVSPEKRQARGGRKALGVTDTAEDLRDRRPTKKRRRTPTQILKEMRERQAVKELAKNPEVTSRALALVLECHATTVIRLQAWKNRKIVHRDPPGARSQDAVQEDGSDRTAEDP